MPTPIEILLNPVSLGVLALYGAMMLVEALAPGRELPRVSGWIPRALASFSVYFYLSSYLPLLWDGYLARYQLLDLGGLGPIAGAAAGLFVYEGLVYAWHRAMHESDWLFRTFHQMHHSAERLDTYGAFYFSPLDMAGFTLVGSLSLSLVVGLSPQAVTLFLFVTLFLGICGPRATRFTTARRCTATITLTCPFSTSSSVPFATRPASRWIPGITTVRPPGSSICCCAGTSLQRKRSCVRASLWRKPRNEEHAVRE
jgi:hypothetical protein